MRIDGCNDYGQNEQFFLIIPFNEVSIDLQGKDVKEEMSNITMKESTDEDSPDLVIDVESGEVLVLETVERTVPSYVCLFPRIVVGQQNDEHYGIDDSKDEGD